MSDWLRSLRGNERCERIAHFAHSLIFGQKTSYSLGNQMSEFPAMRVSVPKFIRVICFNRLLKPNIINILKIIIRNNIAYTCGKCANIMFIKILFKNRLGKSSKEQYVYCIMYILYIVFALLQDMIS